MLDLIMLRDIHFLVAGDILLTIGLIGYFTKNPFLGFLSLILAVVFFVRQLVKIYLVRRSPNPPLVMGRVCFRWQSTARIQSP